MLDALVPSNYVGPMADDDGKVMEGNDSWRRIKGLMGDAKTGGQQAAKGVVDLVKVHEREPCYACKSWEQNERKLAQHFRAHGMIIDPDGTIRTPLAKDSKNGGGALMVPDVENGGTRPVKIQLMGWCRRDCRPTEIEGHCQAFNQVRRREEMTSRLALIHRMRES